MTAWGWTMYGVSRPRPERRSLTNRVQRNKGETPRLRADSAHIGGAREQIANFNRDPVPVDDDGALRNGHVVSEDVDRILLGRLELDDGAAAKAKHLVHRHGGRAKHDGDVDSDFIDRGHKRLPFLCVSLKHHVTMVWLANG